MSALPLAAIDEDVDVERFVLDVVSRKIKSLDYRVENSIVDGELERTIEGASTLTVTVHDPKRVLLRSGLFAYAIDTRVDRLFFRLVQVQKNGSDLTLTFEDREVAYLRQHTKARKASRGKITRAQFALSLVREVKKGGGIPFVCPELTKKQPIGSKRAKRTSKSRHANRDKGLPSGVKLTVKGAPASGEQRKNMQRALDVADSLNAGPKSTLALVEAIIVESQCRNLSGGDADSRGILQVRDSTARGINLDNRDVEACCNHFLRKGFWGKGGAMEIARKNPGMTAGTVAQQTQGSAHPERYDLWRDEATKIVEAYGGAAGSDAGSGDVRTITTRKAYEFRRGTQDGKHEDSWTCLQRLAQEVEWRCFMSGGKLYFVAEDTLFRSKPRLVITEETDGVSDVDFDVDNGKISSEVTITARASRWLGAPGSVVMLDDCGPADGRWLISSIRRGLFSAEATIVLKRPTKRLPEPEADTSTKTLSSKRGGQLQAGANVPQSVARAYSRAKSIDAKGQAYKWGGGHGGFNDPGGYDCSGFVSSCLHAGGLLSGSPQSTPGLKGWGVHGEGQYMTVWVKETGDAHASHTFLTFDINQDGKKQFAEAGGANSAHTGFHSPRSTAGFEPRHAGGT